MPLMFTRPKPLDELSALLEERPSVFVLGCNGCENCFGNGGVEGLYRYQQTLAELGRTVVAEALIDLACEATHDRLWLDRLAPELARADAVLVVACGVGVQVVAGLVDKPVVPALDTFSPGGRVGQAWAFESCAECGECLLGLTAGICPVTACAKGLRNGPCGGSVDGRCEVNPELLSCGWARIVERLRASGRLDSLKALIPAADHSRRRPSEELLTAIAALRGGESGR